MPGNRECCDCFTPDDLKPMALMPLYFLPARQAEFCLAPYGIQSLKTCSRVGSCLSPLSSWGASAMGSAERRGKRYTQALWSCPCRSYLALHEPGHSDLHWVLWDSQRDECEPLPHPVTVSGQAGNLQIAGRMLQVGPPASAVVSLKLS